MAERFAIASVNAMDRSEFRRIFGGIYEHSPWVAEQAWELRPFDDRQSLETTMRAVIEMANGDEKLELVRAHPDLAGGLAISDGLTESSRVEQSGAGLDQCSPEELATFRDYNERYRAKFGFPFIVAVKGLTRQQILEQFARRLENDDTAERRSALGEIAKIASLRLADLIDD